MKFLALYLRAPLQSWGASSKFGDQRLTESFPTRSGVLGLLAAAAGVDRGDDAWLQERKSLEMAVFAYGHDGRLMDYHTVGGGFDPKTSRGRASMSAKASGASPSTVVTHREYLQDAAFGVVLSDERDDVVESLAKAVQNPVWGVWLGRKSCIPTEPVFAGLFDDNRSARDALSDRARRRGGKRDEQAAPRCESIVEVRPGEGEETYLDVPESFAKRRYSARTIKRGF